MGKVDGQETSIRIQGREQLNRAIHGDVVAIQLLPKSEWAAAPFVAIEEEDEAEMEKVDPEKQDDIMLDVEDISTVKPMGRVVGIIKRNWRPLCGTIQASTGSSSMTAQNVFFWPMASFQFTHFVLLYFLYNYYTGSSSS